MNPSLARLSRQMSVAEYIVRYRFKPHLGLKKSKWDKQNNMQLNNSISSRKCNRDIRDIC